MKKTINFSQAKNLPQIIFRSMRYTINSLCQAFVIIRLVACVLLIQTVCFSSFAQSTIEQDVGINTSGNNADASSMLDVSSTTKGILIPRMTSVQRLAINSPAEGLLVYDSNQSAFYYYNGTIWSSMSSLGSLIQDSDQDTRIEVEEQSDDDKISMFLNNKEHLRLDTNSFGDLMIQTMNPNNNSNIFIGKNTGINNGISASNATHGKRNTAVGDSTLLNNKKGKENTAVGFGSLFSNTNGQYNSAFGASALNFNTVGSYNTAFGYQSLPVNKSASFNTAIGSRALLKNVTGSSNVALGFSSMFSNVNGSRTVAIGMRTAQYDTLSERNVFIGYKAGAGDDGSFIGHAKSGNVFIGHEAGMLEKNSNLLYIDNSSTINPLIKGDFEADSLIVNGQLTVTEELVIGNSTSTNPVAGTMRWNTSTSDFEGYNGDAWVSLTCCTGTGGPTPPTNAEACRAQGSELPAGSSVALPMPMANAKFGFRAAISGDYFAAAEQTDPQYENDIHFYKRNGGNWVSDMIINYPTGYSLGNSIGSIKMDKEFTAIQVSDFDGGLYYPSIDLYQRTTNGWALTDQLGGSGYDAVRTLIALSNDYILQKYEDDPYYGVYVNVYHLSSSGNYQLTTLNFPPDSMVVLDFMNDLSRCQDVMVVADKNQSVGSQSTAGKVYLMTKVSNTQWNFDSNIYSPATQTNEQFGKSISISGDWLAVAAGSASVVGKVYLYENDGSSWNYFGLVQKPGTTSSDNYASWIKLVGHKLVVRSKPSGVHRYLTYEYDGTNWIEISDDALPSDIQNNDPIDFDGWNVLSGLPKEDVGGNVDAGKVYIDPVD